MKHISIIVPAGRSVLSSIVGAYKVFNAVNGRLMQMGKVPHYTIDLVGIQSKTSLYEGAFEVKPNKHIEEVKKTDLIIVSTIVGDFEEEVERNAAFIPWIKEQRLLHNAEVASLCTGAFLMAATGLLDGKSAATHWMAHEAFQRMFPQVELIPGKIVSEENGLYSSGGAYSFLNLLLHLVEKYSGREMAIWCAKLFEIEFDRSNQNQFAIFQGQKDHADEAVKQAQDIIEQDFADKLNIDYLADKVSVSRRNFVRRFKKATFNTPFEYIQRVKVEAAKKSLESTPQNIAEVMYAVGYNDPKAFRKAFKKHSGLTPLEYREKYNREVVYA